MKSEIIHLPPRTIRSRVPGFYRCLDGNPENNMIVLFPDAHHPHSGILIHHALKVPTGKIEFEYIPFTHAGVWEPCQPGTEIKITV